MDYTFKSGKYEGKSIEQVALTDYTHLRRILFHRNGGGDNLTKTIDDIANRLNNFVPKSKCRLCENPAFYFPVEIKVGPKLKKIDGEYVEYTGTTGVVIDLKDTRCKEHSRNLFNRDASLYEIRFDILKYFSTEPEWVRERVNKSLLDLAGFNGYKKTKKNCEKFIRNLEIRDRDCEEVISSLKATDERYAQLALL